MQRYIKPFYLLLIILAASVGMSLYQLLPIGMQPAVSAATLNAIQKENLLPGTTNWQLTNPTPFDTKNNTDDLGIEGYASVTSARAGDIIKFSVNTTTATFTADIYRLGWYQGSGGRLVQSLKNIPGKSYAIPSPQAGTGLVEAGWPSAFSVTIPSNWVSGMYLVKLTNANGLQSYIPFVVKSTQNSDFVFIHSANTDEAYNVWGSTSLYQDLTQTLPAGRASKVSFDRPLYQNGGSGYMLKWEYPMIRWLEKNGYNVSYLSDVDVHASSSVLLGHHGIIIAGHSEYWSGQMRDHLQAAINSGVNFGAFGANDIFWQIRYEASSSGVANRVVVCYKDASLDPLTNVNNQHVTVQFRQDPVNRPEQELLGSMANSFFAEDEENQGFALVIKDASSWVYAGTNLRNGDSLAGLVGYEFDSVFNQYQRPIVIIGNDGVKRVEILSASPVTDFYNNQVVANSTLYTASGGARVFNAGTIQWSWGLDNWSQYADRANVASTAAQQITANILHNFLTGAVTPAVLVK